jgi:integrase
MKPSELRCLVESYLALRDAVGSSLPERKQLLDFVAFAGIRSNGSPVRADIATEWACSSTKAGAAGRARRLTIARGFLSYLRAFCPDTEVPSVGLFPRSRPLRPHIFSGREVERLQAVAMTLDPHRPLCGPTYVALIGLLASCGLRIGEALRLTLADVQLDVEPSILVVRETKFRKSRLVPLHMSCTKKLQEYWEKRNKVAPRSLAEPFFLSARHGFLKTGSAMFTFRKLCRRAEVRSARAERSPTLHGLRHTFAVRRLESWQRQGIDITTWLPHLSVYMGHAAPENTYWYLTVSPELLGPAAVLFEHYATDRGDR